MKTPTITLRPLADGSRHVWIDSARLEGYYKVRHFMARARQRDRLEFLRRPCFPRHDGPWRYVGRVGRASLWHAPATGRYYAFILDAQGYLVAEAIGASRDVALHQLLRRLPRYLTNRNARA